MSEKPYKKPSEGHLARNLRLVIGAGALALVVSLILGSFSTAGIINMTAAYLMLGGAWCFAVIAVVVSEPVWGLRLRHRILIGIGASAFLAVVFGGLALFEYRYHPKEIIAESHLEVTRLEPIKDPTAPRYIFKLHIQNSSDVPADVPIRGYIFHVADERLSKTDEDADMEKILTGIKSIPLNTTVQDEILKGHDVSMLLDEQPISEDDFKKISDGSKKLYLFLIMRYIDKNSTPGTCHQTEFCGFFTGGFSEWNFCYAHLVTKDCD